VRPLAHYLLHWYLLKLLTLARVYAGLIVRENDDTCVSTCLACVCIHSVHCDTFRMWATTLTETFCRSATTLFISSAELAVSPAPSNCAPSHSEYVIVILETIPLLANCFDSSDLCFISRTISLYALSYPWGFSNSLFMGFMASNCLLC